MESGNHLSPNGARTRSNRAIAGPVPCVTDMLGVVAKAQPQMVGGLQPLLRRAAFTAVADTPCAARCERRATSAAAMDTPVPCAGCIQPM